MAKVVLTASDGTKYQDEEGLRYHFPNRYLSPISAAVGDWAIFYQPRRNDGPTSNRGSQSYTAMARITQIYPDRNNAGHHFAELSEYIKFDQRVPFKSSGHYFESALQKADGTTNRGSFGWSARPLPEAEFSDIFEAGFFRFLLPDPAALALPEEADVTERATSTSLVTKKVRDRAFRSLVRDAYKNTCAFTGLSIVAPNGRIEAQAAHIRSVACNGPDTADNGIALCSTMHWMFDQGLVSLTDDCRIITASVGLPSNLPGFLCLRESLALPESADHAPRRSFLHWHRTHVFIG